MKIHQTTTRSKVKELRNDKAILAAKLEDSEAETAKLRIAKTKYRDGWRRLCAEFKEYGLVRETKLEQVVGDV